MNRNIEAGSVWFYTGKSKTKVIDIGTSDFCILQTITCCIGNSDWYKREPIEEGGKDE
jgi:hypothetical protein